MDWGNVYWPLWIIAVVATLAGPELYALFSVGHNTLSEWVWSALQVSKDQQRPWTYAHTITFIGWVTLTLWSTYHFFFRRFL